MKLSLKSNEKKSSDGLNVITKQFSGLDLNNPYTWPVLPKVLLCGCLSVAVVILSWFLYLNSFETELSTEKNKEVELRKEYSTKIIKSASLDELKNQREQVQQYVLQLEKQLPSRSEMSALLSDINQSGVGRSLQFELFKPDNEIIKEYYAELPISLRVSGQFHDMGMFASDIANLSRIVTLNNISIAPKNKDGALTFEAIAKTYRYLDAEEINAQRKTKKK